MSKTKTGADLRESILKRLSPDLHATTREIAASVGASDTSTFRELSQLEREGAITMRFGSAGIAGVGWRLVSAHALAMPL